MENSELTTIITGKPAILRCLTDISEQNLPLIISTTGDHQSKVFQSSILKVEDQNNQLILHQLTGHEKSASQINEIIEVICHSKNGKLKFSGLISPLDNDDNTLYSSLTLPKKLSKKQLRSCFRVSLSKFKSKTSLELDEGTEVFGTCRDISMNGALFYLPASNNRIKQGALIEQCKLAIFDELDLTCAAKVCHVKNTPGDNILVGLNFLDLDIAQLNTIRPAMSKLERLNILL